MNTPFYFFSKNAHDIPDDYLKYKRRAPGEIYSKSYIHELSKTGKEQEAVRYMNMQRSALIQ